MAARPPAEPAPVTLGLIADTHLPDRCPALPPAVFTALAGVDLVLHAGDIGELRVLDELSAIAPVVAVHGNDEMADAQDHLPYQQVIAIAGRRLLLCHGHDPDLQREMANRVDDAWGPKLDRRVAQTRAVGASIMVFGHLHIPLCVQRAGVWLVNPGAIAAANGRTRQARQTVARLTIPAAGPPAVTHIDLARPDQPYTPAIAWAAGFQAALNAVTASILTPELAADWARLRADLVPLAPAVWPVIVRQAALPCWLGQRATYGHADLLAALLALPDVPPDLRDELARRLPLSPTSSTMALE
jgi:putative phosphoesterase